MNFTEAKGRSGLTVGDKAKAGMPLFKAVRFFIRLLGPNIAFFLGKVVGIIAARFTPRELRVVAAQLAYAQNQTDSLKNLTPQKLLTENYIHLSRSFVELYFFDVFLEKAKIDETNAANRHYPRLKCIEAVGLEECRELARSNQGALFLSAHIGNFELLAAYHILGGLTVTILGKEPNYEILKNWVQDTRDRYGAEALLRGDDSSSKRQSAVASIKALKENRTLALLPDQDTGLQSEFVPYFNLDAAFVVAPIKMSIKNRKRIFTSFIVRTDRFKHQAISEEIKYDPDSPTAAEDILKIYSSRLQEVVEKYPEQYLWFHRRWRRRPGVDYEKTPDAIRSTNDYLDWLGYRPQ